MASMRCYFYSATVNSRNGDLRASTSGVVDAIPPTPETLVGWYDELKAHIGQGLEKALQNGGILNIVSLNPLD